MLIRLSEVGANALVTADWVIACAINTFASEKHHGKHVILALGLPLKQHSTHCGYGTISPKARIMQVDLDL